ncbi:MAG: alpha-galactosidase [Kiritimatiellaeota bacterium]|nr:alpha-galactosidase [Kiritimatiellota bacterium]
MMTRTLRRLGPVVTILAAWATAPGAVGAGTAQPPPNASATVEWNAARGRLSLRYHGGVIFEATLCAEDAAGRAVAGAAIQLDPAEAAGEKVEQRLKFILAEPREAVKLVLRGAAAGSEEAFAAETAGEAQQRFPLVRNSVGPSRNLRNNAVYDRRWDWMLEGPADGATRILPKGAEGQGIAFTWESRSSTTSTSSGQASSEQAGQVSLELVFRPRFYQKHKELPCFEPWTYRVWKEPVTGYCTWWAYRDGFNQKTLDKLVDVFVEKKLPDFGYLYIQLDDAYQTGWGGCPQNWLTWNGKFPGGAEYAVKRIKAAGMKPGIWVNRLHRPSDPHITDIGRQHPDWFIHKPDGDPTINGDWHTMYILNTKNQEAIEGMVRPTYRALKEQGWDYVKIDGAGDLLYASRKPQCAADFKKIGSTPEESLRAWDQVAREELGPDIYILTCWGVHPGINSIGLADGCRLSDDGFGPATFQRFASWNGVVWRGDPDHCDIMAPAFKDKTTMKTFGAAAAMADTIDQPAVVAMAGGVLMLSDKVEDYQNDSNLEGLKRSAPVLFTVPGQLYDYGNRPNRDHGAPKRGGEVSWWLQEIDRPFEHWSVLARFNWRQGKLKWARAGHPETEVKFADLGLADDREYLVFEFWTQTFLGKSQGSFKAPAQAAGNALQVFAIREARPHPWVLSTTRHLSQGGVDLLDERWDARRATLTGRSAVVSGDPYALTVHLPAGFKLKDAEIAGGKVETAQQAETATVRLVPAATQTVEWKIEFTLKRNG